MANNFTQENVFSFSVLFNLNKLGAVQLKSNYTKHLIQHSIEIVSNQFANYLLCAFYISYMFIVLTS